MSIDILDMKKKDWFSTGRVILLFCALIASVVLLFLAGLNPVEPHMSVYTFRETCVVNNQPTPCDVYRSGLITTVSLEIDGQLFYISAPDQSNGQ